MPGPVSDSYDPEWGTAAKGEEIREELQEMYRLLSEGPLAGTTPIDIRKLVDMTPSMSTAASFNDKQWRLLRFALERAMDSL